MKRILLTSGAALLVFAACSGEPDAPEDSGPVDGGTLADGGAPAEDAPMTSLGDEQTAWSYRASATTGASLTYFQPEGEPVMRLTCHRDTGTFEVAVPQVERIGSEERLTFGSGGRLEAIPVPLSIPAGGPVAGDVPLSQVLVASLGGGEFGATYGANVVTPKSVPREELLTRFVTACEAALSVEAAQAEQDQLQNPYTPAADAE